MGAISRTRIGLIAAALLFTSLSARNAGAQERPAPSVAIEAGWVGFADDGIASELLVGGAARIYLLPRISVGPEVVYLSSQFHSHLVVTGNLTFDILHERSGRAAIPFLVIGGGLFQTRDTFVNNESFTSNEGAFTAGGGVRVVVTDRVTAGLEARMGWEPHIRVNGLIGIKLGK